MAIPDIYQEGIDEAIQDACKSALREALHAPEEIRGIFHYLAKQAFAPGFKIQWMDRDDVATPALRRRFREVMGKPCSHYVQELKARAAKELLIETGLLLEDIAEGFGYGEGRAHNFSRDFKRWTGESPTEFRDAHRGEKRDPVADLQYGKVGKSIVRYLPEDEKLARVFAESVWRVIQEEARPRQEAFLAWGVVFAHRALFDVLLEKSREAGERNPVRGREIASLLPIVVESNLPWLGEEAKQLEAQSWKYLADAHRLAGEIDDAEACLERAGEIWDEERNRARPESAQQLMSRALQFFRRCPAEAFRLFGETVTACEAEGDLELEMEARMERIELAVLEEELHVAVADLRQMQKICERQIEGATEKEERDWNKGELFGWTHRLARMLYELGEIEEAALEVDRVEKYFDLIRDEGEESEHLRLVALIAHAQGDLERAERHYRQARVGFWEEDDIEKIALIGLDLAVLCKEQDRPDEALVFLETEVVPVLEPLDRKKESGHVLKRLEEEVAARSVSLSLLREARQAVRTARRWLL